MLKRTHIALGLAIALYFLPHINGNKFIFLGVVLLASLLPDLESGFAAARHHGLFGLDQTKMVYHKNHIIHTYTFLIPLTIILAIISPFLALPFFLGYSFHIFLDSFSINGIRPFWPLKHKAHGKISPGGHIDHVLFYIFLGMDVIVLFMFVMS
ncbi:MAG: metal-dependent hydrolase [Nanoarchaeota archaeon]|nr:metal-dependent hydrolase [Nanoarchaeota archaeon]MBU0977173.1 metal-dependent hydrolase [Nanoarchaeota archaeon]